MTAQYILTKDTRSAPHEVFDKTFKIFSDLSHLVRKFKMCGRKVNFLSKITPKNLAVSE